MAKVKEFKYKIVDDSGNVIEKTTAKLSVLEEASKKTSEALKNADIGSDKWKELKAGVEQNEKAFAKAEAKSKGLIKSLESIPGPIGQVAQGFTGIGKAASAFVANPIGAILGALAIAFVAIKNALDKTEKGFQALNKITAVFGEIIDPVIGLFEDFAAMLAGGVAKGLELIAGLMGGAAAEAGKLSDATLKLNQAEKDAAVSRAQTNQALAEAKELLSDTNASYEDRKNALDKIRAAEDAQTKLEVKNAEEKLRIAKALYEAHDDDLELRDKMRDAEIALAGVQQDAAAKQRQFNKEDKKLKAEAAAKEKERVAEQKRLQDEEIANRKAAADKIRKLDEENTLAAIENEKERELKAQEFANAAALREINQMKLTKEEKARLEQEIAEKNQLKIQEINEKYAKEQEQKDKENADKKKKFEQDVANALAVSREQQFQKEQDDTKAQYDELIAQAAGNAELVIQLKAARDAKLLEQQNKFNKETTDAAQAQALEEAKIEEEKVKARAAAADQTIAIVAGAGALLSQIAGKSKGLAIAGVIIEQGAAIGKVITATQIANAGALATPQAIATSGAAAVPVITKNNIAAGISIAQIIAGAAKSISEINKAQVDESGGGGGGETKKMPTTYAQGGLLVGRRHGQGGIATPMGELEGGEYVVNRKSTASFLPLLESINRMGAGGVLGSGNISSGIENAGIRSEPPIIKTYVVASDVTSQQEANKMISDLARL